MRLYIRLTIFVLLSFSISNVFRFNIFETRELLSASLPSWLYIAFVALLEGIGVLVASAIALLMYTQNGKKRNLSLLGSSPALSLLMPVIPIILLTLLGVGNDTNTSPRLYALSAGIASLLYCIMEEYGWRGYLQEEFRQWGNTAKYVAIGSIWYAWHLSFLTAATFSENIFFWAMLVFASWGIGQVAESTKSILACASFHLLVQLVMFNNLIKNGLANNHKIILLAVCITAWIVILRFWKKENSSS